MLFIKRCNCSHSFDLNISFDDGSPLTKVDLFKYLRLWLDPKLSLKPHIDFMIKKSYGCLCSLYRSSQYLSFQVRKILISQLIPPIIDYYRRICYYQNTSDTNLKPLNFIHNSLCIVLRCFENTIVHCMKLYIGSNQNP